MINFLNYLALLCFNIFFEITIWITVHIKTSTMIIIVRLKYLVSRRFNIIKNISIVKIESSDLRAEKPSDRNL